MLFLIIVKSVNTLGKVTLRNLKVFLCKQHLPTNFNIQLYNSFFFLLLIILASQIEKLLSRFSRTSLKTQLKSYLNFQSTMLIAEVAIFGKFGNMCRKKLYKNRWEIKSIEK